MQTLFRYLHGTALCIRLPPWMWSTQTKLVFQYQVETNRSLRRRRFALPRHDGKAGPSGLE